MPRNSDSSGSNSSPEKPIKRINIKKRQPIRDDQREFTDLYPQLPKTPIIYHNEQSPIKSPNDEYSDEDRDRTSPSPAPKNRHRTPAPPDKKSTPQLNSNHLRILIAIISIVVVAISVSFISPIAPKSTQNCSQFMDLQNSFPGQDKKLFKSLKAGVEGILEGKPMVISLFSTDMTIVDKIMEKVIIATQKCINQSQDPISLTSEQLGPKMVDNYKEELIKRSIMIINNVEDALPITVSSLHSFCDTYNPLVSRSVIFFTIQVPSKPPGKPVEYITDFLNQRWKTLDGHIRNPLITRMLDQTFFLAP